jgi:hypothetical protein
MIPAKHDSLDKVQIATFYMSSASSIWWWLWLGKEIMGRWCWLEHTSSFGSRPFKTINPIGRISGVRFGSRHNRHWLVDVA